MKNRPDQPQAPPQCATTLSSPILSYEPQAGPATSLDKLYTPQIRKNTSSYDQCRVERTPKFLTTHQWGATVSDAARFAGVAAVDPMPTVPPSSASCEVVEVDPAPH